MIGRHTHLKKFLMTLPGVNLDAAEGCSKLGGFWDIGEIWGGIWELALVWVGRLSSGGLRGGLWGKDWTGDAADTGVTEGMGVGAVWEVGDGVLGILGGWNVKVGAVLGGGGIGAVFSPPLVVRVVTLLQEIVDLCHKNEPV